MHHKGMETHNKKGGPRFLPIYQNCLYVGLLTTKNGRKNTVVATKEKQWKNKSAQEKHNTKSGQKHN